MRLLTLNCHSWLEKDQLDKIKYLAKTIKEEQYDVIAMQEVSQSINKDIIYNNIKEDNFVYLLNEELKKLDENNYNFIWDFSHIGYDIYEEGLAILTKHNISSYESFYVSNSIREDFYKTRKIIKADISINNEEISFFSCHLGWWNDEHESFEKQVNKLIKKIDKKSFIMGDFNNNAFVRNEGYDYMISKNLIDTYNLAIEKDSGMTVEGEIAGWEGKKEEKRLDIIFTTEKVDILKSNVIFNEKNRKIISDHYGVEIKI